VISPDRWAFLSEDDREELHHSALDYWYSET
jgi:hypothetical protein